MTSKKRRTSSFGAVPGTTTALLSAPSKMPGYSWSLPAHMACPRANGDICDNCYADKGFYKLYRGVKLAQMARFSWTRDCMRSDSGRREWVNVMVRAIRKTRAKYFRVHDSGDLFSPAYAGCWFQVAAELPHVVFWIPTRTWQQPSGPLPIFDPLLDMLRLLAELPNVTVRPSALNFGDAAPVVTGLHAGTTADCPTARQCPAHSQNNQCGSCRVCWNEKTVAVSYSRH